jgi:ribokinase
MIVVLGSINADQIGVVERLPVAGETVLGTSFRLEAGGKGANQALAARRAGAEVALFGAVGNDHFAKVAQELMRRDGVDLAGVEVSAVNTGIAIIVVDAVGENQIAVLPGANGTIGVAAVRRAIEHCEAEGVLVLQQEIPAAATRLALELARKKGLRSVLNIAPFVEETPSVAHLASVVVANETEFALLVGSSSSDLEAEVLALAARHHQAIIVTLGERGVLVGTAARITHIPAKPVRVIDTVGAGDTFCGYLAAGLSAGQTLEDAARRAAVAASLACTARGAQPAIPFASDVDRVL